MLTTRYSMPATVMGFAAENDFDGLGVVAGRQHRFYFFDHLRRQIDVVSLASVLVVEMGVRPEIRTVAGGAAFEIHRAHEVAGDEGFEAVVDGGERKSKIGVAGQLQRRVRRNHFPRQSP